MNGGSTSTTYFPEFVVTCFLFKNCLCEDSDVCPETVSWERDGDCESQSECNSVTAAASKKQSQVLKGGGWETIHEDSRGFV